MPSDSSGFIYLSKGRPSTSLLLAVRPCEKGPVKFCFCYCGVERYSVCLLVIISGVPERVHLTKAHDLVHNFGERELNVLYYCLMYDTVNAFILVSVNCTFTVFNFVK